MIYNLPQLENFYVVNQVHKQFVKTCEELNQFVRVF
jgi:hypothetical protein